MQLPATSQQPFGQVCGLQPVTAALEALQAPFRQTWPGRQAVPQVPQLAESLVRSLQAPLQQV